jgi:hypothetical protein
MGDAVAEANHRCSRVPGTRLDIVTQLQHFLHANHVYVPLFKTALERMPTDDYKVAIRAEKHPRENIGVGSMLQHLTRLLLSWSAMNFVPVTLLFRREIARHSVLLRLTGLTMLCSINLYFGGKKMATTFKYHKTIFSPPTLSQGKRLQLRTSMPTKL